MYSIPGLHSIVLPVELFQALSHSYGLSSFGQEMLKEAAGLTLLDVALCVLR